MAQQEISNPTIADSGAVHNSWSSIANDLWHGEIQKASTDVINNVSASGKAFASDPVGSLIDFTTPIGVVDHFAGTHIGTAISDVAAGEAKEVIDHPGTVAWDVGLGIGFGALTVATGGGFAVGLALGGAVIAGGELIKNKGNEVDGAINDANSVVDGVKSFGNDVSVVAGTGQHKQDEEAAAQQGLENAGAFVTQTVAFGVGAGIGAGLATSIAAVGDASAGATPSAIAAASAKPTLADIKPLDTTVPVNASQPVAANVLEVPTSPASQPVTSSVPEVSTSSASQAAGANLPVDAPNAVAQTPGDGATGTGNGAANPEGTGPKSPGDNAETKKPTTDSTVLEANTVKVMIGGAEVPVTAPPGVDVNAVVNSKPFGDWVKNLDPNIKIGANGIKIDAVKMFGKKPGFTLLTADATDATTDKPVPGIVFMRGNSVGVLPVLVGPDGSEYAAIVNQTRVPEGWTDEFFLRIPAGMDGQQRLTQWCGNCRSCSGDRHETDRCESYPAR